MLVSLCLQVRANVVAVTLDISEEELHFQFDANNWSSYVDQVQPLHPSLPFPPSLPLEGHMSVCFI